MLFFFPQRGASVILESSSSGRLEAETLQLHSTRRWKGTWNSGDSRSSGGAGEGERTGNRVTHIRVTLTKTAIPHWIPLPISGTFCLSQLYTGMGFGNAANNKTGENTPPLPPANEKQTNASGAMKRKGIRSGKSISRTPRSNISYSRGGMS